MKQLFQETLAVLDGAFSMLEAQVPSPQQIRWRDGFVFRYVEQTIHQAILLKLVRMISGLRAALVLLENGFVQEQAVMQRGLDEMGDDIMFLVYAVTNDRVTELHERYLEAFFQEEFDPAIAPIDSPQNRPMIPRKKIHAYLAAVGGKASKQQGKALNSSDGVKLSKTLSKTYSGYVHAAAPHIMDLYGGNPPAFHLEGMLGTPRIPEHADDLWNYFYRGLMTFVAAARAFGDKECADYVYENLKRFEGASGDKLG